MVADPMPVVALGCEAMLRRANKFRTQVLINPEADELLEMIELNQPDLLLVNPLFCKLPGKCVLWRYSTLGCKTCCLRASAHPYR